VALNDLGWNARGYNAHETLSLPFPGIDYKIETKTTQTGRFNGDNLEQGTLESFISILGSLWRFSQ
jgi:hypothetical protein